MNRRDALKNLTMSIGFTVATPTLLGILNSCTAKAETWTPKFLSETEKHIITNLVDLILPSTNTPGALNVNIPQFLDMMYYDMETKLNQQLFSQGADFFSKKAIQTLHKDISKGTKEDFNVLLKTYFNLSKEDSNKILRQQKLALNKIPDKEIETYHIYKFLLSVRYYTLLGYFTSKEVGKNVLNYDPIPGSYQGCISINDTPNKRAWSLP